MNIIKKFIKNTIEYFKYQCGPTPKKLEDTSKVIKENAISFSVDEWNRFIIRIKLELSADGSSEEFGKMLFFINDGKYEQSIVDTIMDMIAKQNIKPDAAQKMMSAWATLLAENIDSGSEPCVRPSQVFSNK